MLIFLFFLFPITAVATNYYVDATLGSDGNSGQSTLLPWKTIAKVNASDLKSVDSVYFKRGEIWYEELLIPPYGPLLYGAYGAGAAPIISGMGEVAGWSTAASWTDAGGNIWRMTVSRDPRRIWLDGVEYPIATDPSTVDALRSLSANLFVIDAYGKILPKDVLEIPKFGCVNLHPSLLPKYRGATPVPFTILGGETETGMTFMRMSEGMDEGDILTVVPDRVLPTDDAPTLLDRLNALAAGQIGDILTDYVEGKITPVPQDHGQATYSTLLTKEHGRIDWATDTAVMVGRKLRAYAPWPGIFTYYQGKRLKILACEAAPSGPSAPSGSLVTPDLIATADGLVRLVTLQPEGRSPMPFAEFLRGIREKDPVFG